VTTRKSWNRSRRRYWSGKANSVWVAVFGAALAACATPAPTPKVVDAPPAVDQAAKAAQERLPEVKRLKRKIAIGRFTNETLYGRALLTGAQLDAMGRQTGDILSARLVETKRFIVLERPDIAAVTREGAIGGTPQNLVGANALIIGSLTEFGRQTEGQSGFLSRTKRQVARAKVDLRLIDPATGVAFFAASGTGEASTESGTVMGFGSKTAYDATLNDRAISAAIADVMNVLVNQLEARPWQSDVLDVDGRKVVISGGARQGLKPGQELAILTRGKSVKSQQTGFMIELPATEVARVRVISTFGSDETNEGAITSVESGQVLAQDRAKLIVREGSQ
jgi:curli biogenesis system outer membrane secretion channel CsgG